jgi:hypothetical protein
MMGAYVVAASIGILISCAGRTGFLRDLLVLTVLWALIKGSAFDQKQRFEICSRLASALATGERPAAEQSADSYPALPETTLPLTEGPTLFIKRLVKMTRQSSTRVGR